MSPSRTLSLLLLVLLVGMSGGGGGIWDGGVTVRLADGLPSSVAGREDAPMAGGLPQVRVLPGGYPLRTPQRSMSRWLTDYRPGGDLPQLAGVLGMLDVIFRRSHNDGWGAECYLSVLSRSMLSSTGAGCILYICSPRLESAIAAGTQVRKTIWVRN